MKPPTWSTGSARPGFTLVELMVVATVIAVLATMLVPQFMGRVGQAALSTEARSLESALRYARSEAVLRQRVTRIVFQGDIDENKEGPQPGYRLEVQTNDPQSGMGFEPAGSGPVRARPLARQVRLTSIVTPEPREGDPQVRFFPAGRADAAALQLTDGQQTWTVLVEPVAGRVQTVPRAVSELPSEREDLDA